MRMRQRALQKTELMKKIFADSVLLEEQKKQRMLQ